MKIIKQDLKIYIYPSGAWYISWRKNNLRHREDGQASIWNRETKFYWLGGERYLESDYWKEIHENY